MNIQNKKLLKKKKQKKNFQKLQNSFKSTKLALAEASLGRASLSLLSV